MHLKFQAGRQFSVDQGVHHKRIVGTRGKSNADFPTFTLLIMEWTPHILYEDNHYIAISKPAGIPVQAESTEEDGVINRLQEYIGKRDKKPGKAFIGVLHRLDKAVTGVLILAKTSKGQERFNELLRKKEVRKFYFAVTEKNKMPMEGTLTHFFSRKGEEYKMSVSQRQGSEKDQEAILKYAILSVSDDYQMLGIELITGRRHQIRAQLAYMGCPILGDKRYGSKVQSLGIALHCCRIQFVHPVKQIPLTISSLPHGMDEAWKPFKNKMEAVLKSRGSVISSQ